MNKYRAKDICIHDTKSDRHTYSTYEFYKVADVEAEWQELIAWIEDGYHDKDGYRLYDTVKRSAVIEKINEIRNKEQ